MEKLTFAVVGDLHVGGVTEEIKTFIRLCNSRPLDFVLFLGDLVDVPTDENVDELVREIKTLKKPYYLTIGNHDTGKMEDGFDIEEKLRAALDGPWKESFTYSFRAKGWNFIPCSITTGKIPYIGLQVNHYKGHMCESGGVVRIPEHHLKRFQKLLEESADTPTCVITHVPLARMAKRVRARGCFCQVHMLEELQMMSLLEWHPNVKMTLHGHEHFNQVDVVDGRLSCITQGVKGYGPYRDPSAIRIMEIAGNRVRSYLIWENNQGEPPGRIGTLEGDKSFEWEWK